MLSLSLSRTTGYAIQALSMMQAEGGRRVLAHEIAERTGIPSPYLSKTLHALGRRGLITTKRGFHGGFMLAAPPEKISLLQIADAVEGPQWRSHCLLGMTECSDERACPTHAFWKAERARVETELRRLTLAELSAFHWASPKPPRRARRRTKRPRS